MTKAERICRIAYNTRKWAEQYARVHRMPRDLERLCAIASAELHKRYHRAKIKSRLAYSNVHCFVLVGGEFIVDVTATQFDWIPEVKNLIGKNNVLIDLYTCVLKAAGEIYAYESLHTSKHGLLKKQKKDGWPKGQWAR